MKNITPTLPSPLRGGGLGGGQRAPEVKSCDHRKNYYGPFSIGAKTNFQNFFAPVDETLKESRSTPLKAHYPWPRNIAGNREVSRANLPPNPPPEMLPVNKISKTKRLANIHSS